MLIIIITTAFIAAVGLTFIRYNHDKDEYHTWQRNVAQYGEEAVLKAGHRKVEEPQLRLVVPLSAATTLSVLAIVFESLTVVPAGHIGVQVTFGEVNQATLPEGMHLVNPMSRIREIDVRMVSTKLTNGSAGTKDLQQVHTDIVLNYRLDGSKAAHIYKEFGLDLNDRVIVPALSEAFKAVTAHYTSEELITKRDEVSNRIREEIAAKLAKYSISVNDISLMNFAFSDDYQKAIEAKVISTQSKLKAEQDLERIKIEAQQSIARAEGEAKAIAIQSQAIQTNGGANYVQLKAIEKWDGNLPNVMSGTVPFINVK